MTTLYFLAIPIVLILVAAGVRSLTHRTVRTGLEHDIDHFNSELGALAPHGTNVVRREPVRHYGNPYGDNDGTPVDVLLAQDHQSPPAK